MVKKGQTWIASGGTPGTFNNLERAFEDRGDRKSVVNTVRLDIAVDRNESGGEGVRGGPSGGVVTVSYERRCHL